MGRPRKSVAEKKADAEKRALAKEQEKEQLQEKEETLFIDVDAEIAEDEVIEEEELEAELEEESVEDALTEIKKEETSKTRKQLDRNMLVKVASFVVGTLIYKSDRTGATYIFREFGAEDEIELFELQAMRSAYPKFLLQPWLIVLDDDVVEYLALQDIYSKMVKPSGMDKFLKLKPDKMESILKDAPKGFKDAVLDKVQLLMKENKFDSIARIQAIERATGFELRD